MYKLVHKWIDTDFESSSYETEQFRSFANDFKKELKEECKKHGLVPYSGRIIVGHFELSGFLGNPANERLVYFSVRDVRGSSEWANSVLYRTAGHGKDYKGGTNNYASMVDFVEAAKKLTESDRAYR